MFLYTFSIKQLLTVKRILPILAVCLIPAVLALFDSVQLQDVTPLIISFLVPVLALFVAIPAFSDEIESKTLYYIIFTPVKRWTIVLSKWGASFTIGILLFFISVTVITLSLFINSADIVASEVVGFIIGGTVAMIAYTFIFLWVGMKFSRPFVVGILYILIWEFGLNFVGTVAGSGENSNFDYLSINGYAVGILSNISSEQDPSLNVWGASVGLVIVILGFLYISIRKVKTMDVP